jgi:hypothetical protein
MFSYSIAAKTPQWQVKPTICISEKAEELCSFVIQITQLGLPLGPYCLTLGKQTLGCFKKNEFPLNLAVQLSENTELMLLDQQQNIVLTKTILIKSQQANSQRRRLRSPWSIF